MNTASVRFLSADGLIPAIIQDSQSREVLMLGYMNAESLELSNSTRYVYFYSRSRATLWKKGETSGNTLKIDTMSIDCDGDALRIEVTVCGSAVCHTGNRSCFFTPLGRDI